MKGYTVLTVIGGEYNLCWSQETDGVIMPDMYDTKQECEAEIADLIIHQLGEVIEGERTLVECDEVDNYYIAEIEMKEDGTIIVWEPSGTFRNRIIETNLEQWRKSR